TPELKDAICEKLRRDNGLAYERTEVMASCGGKHALYNAFQALFEEGDEGVVPAPYWGSYTDMLLLAGATPRIVETAPEGHFRMSAQQLDAAGGAPRARPGPHTPGDP